MLFLRYILRAIPTPGISDTKAYLSMRDCEKAPLPLMIYVKVDPLIW